MLLRAVRFVARGLVAGPTAASRTPIPISRPQPYFQTGFQIGSAAKGVSLQILCLRLKSTVVSGAARADVHIPRARIEATFARSSGAGGQNVNKLNTKAQLRFHVDSADWMDEEVRARLKVHAASYMTKEGDLVLTSQEHRTQGQNLEEAFTKLRDLVAKAAEIPVVRELVTDLGEHSKENRRDFKRHRSEVKARRRGRGDDD